jgi:hypothetical protein
MEASDYPYGDSKTEDSANFGIFKNNWYMIRTACSQFSGQTEADWNNGAALKYVFKLDTILNISNLIISCSSNDYDAIVCQHQQMSKYPGQQWWGGQRYGSKPFRLARVGINCSL